MKKLIFAVLGFIIVSCSNQSIEDGLDNLNARLVELEQEIAAIEAADLIGQINEITTQVQFIESQQETLIQSFEEITASLALMNQELLSIIAQIEEAATLEQLNAIGIKINSINEGIAQLVFRADYDLDGIINGLDECVYTPITEIAQIDENGCGPSEID